MLPMEKIQKAQSALLKQDKLFLSFLKPFFPSLLLSLPPCWDTRSPDSIIGDGRTGVMGWDARARCALSSHLIFPF